MRVRLLSAIIALLLLTPGAARAETRAQAASILNSCAAAIRKIPPGSRNFKTPPACKKASRIFNITGSGKPPVRVDATWIEDDLASIREKFGKPCPGCEKQKKKEKKSLKKNKRDSRRSAKKQNQDEQDEPDEDTPCINCRDTLWECRTRGEALARLADTVAYSSATGAPAPMPEQSISQAKNRAAAILKRKEFQFKPKSPAKRHKWKFFEKLRDWLDRHIPDAKPPEQRPGGQRGLDPGEYLRNMFRATAITIIIFALALAAAFIVVRWRRLLAEDATESDDGEQPERPAAAAKHISEAERLRARGEYRLAIRSIFLAFLRGLEQKDLVIFIRNKTNREYLAELRRRKPVGPAVEDLTSQYEEAWYGMKDCSAEDFDQFMKTYETTGKEI